MADGHEIGNHTWSHARSSTLADAELRSELERTGAEVERTCGIRPTLARPPYGDDAERFAAIGAQLGLTTVLWSIDPRDWEQPPAPAIAERTVAALHPGAIVLLHDGWRRGSSRTSSAPTAEALASLLPALGERGYRCVTVSELLPAGRLEAAAPSAGA